MHSRRFETPTACLGPSRQLISRVPAPCLWTRASSSFVRMPRVAA